MTHDECNDALRQNLSESIRHVSELRDLLKTERDALESKDAAALADTADRKQQFVNELDLLDRARIALSKSLGFGINPEEIAKLAAHCDTNSELAQSWQRFLALAEECSGMNSGNGAIIRVRQQQIQGAIHLLRDGTTETDTYGPNGQSNEDSRTRPLAEA